MLSDHIPDNNSEFSGGGGDDGVSPFSVAMRLKKGARGGGLPDFRCC